MVAASARPPAMPDVSTTRLYLMRALYLVNAVLVGSSIWPPLLNQSAASPLMEGVAFSFYAALSTLSLLGLRYPLKMVPLLFVQLFYKSAWLLAVALPLSSAGLLRSELSGAVMPFVIGVALDILVIPWPYVVASFALAPGDRWKPATSHVPLGVEGVPPNER
jgi:hypothetical protein